MTHEAATPCLVPWSGRLYTCLLIAVSASPFAPRAHQPNLPFLLWNVRSTQVDARFAASVK